MKIELEAENRTILRMYRALLRKARPYLQDDDARQIRKAFKFAVNAHKDMRRRSGEPYIYHPLEVAMICVSEIGLGPTSIISALLHDVVEDTGYEIKDIERHFGKKVARIIDGLTKISANSAKGNSLQAENFRKMLLTISEDIRVVLIKIADRLHNMRTLDSMPKDKQLKIKSETEYIYAPLAHRLGLYNIKSELEDLCLKYTDRKAYDEIRQKLEESEEARRRFTKSFSKPIERDLKRNGMEFKIKARTKSIYSIYRKMKTQGVPFEEVFDLFAIRIILQNPISYETLPAGVDAARWEEKARSEERALCWKTYSSVTDHYTPNVNRLRDWISVGKTNGYESLHTTVMGPNGRWVEVQIRTERMDDIAEKGYAAHWKYKESRHAQSTESGIEMWLAKVREILENNDLNAIEFLDEFRANLFNKEVFVFTPKGDLKVLPSGATVLDFAFDIHTEVGARSLGAKIDGRLVPLNHRLENGDQVEILTANKPKANEGWLKFVTTARAKAKIKEYLREDKKRVIMEGKEIVERKLRHLKLPINDLVILQELMDFFDLKSESEFFFRVGAGLIDHTAIKRFRDVKKELATDNKIRPGSSSEFKDQIKKLRKTAEDELVIGENMNEVDYSLATCCAPIPGDDIFGFITVNNGIKIHRSSCKNAVAMMSNYGYRIIKARWANDHSRVFEVELRIEGTDRMGLVKDVTRIISDQMKVNISNVTFSTKSGLFNGRIEISVHDAEEVQKLIRRLESIEGVLRITRSEAQPV